MRRNRGPNINIKEMIPRDDTNAAQRRELIQQDVDKFLANGGVIEKVPIQKVVPTFGRKYVSYGKRKID